MSHPIFPAAPLMEEWTRATWDVALDAPDFVSVSVESRSTAAKVLAAFASSASVIREVNVVDPVHEWNITVRSQLNDQPFDVLRFLPLKYEGIVLISEGAKMISFSGEIDGVIVRVSAVFPERSPFPLIIRNLWNPQDSQRDKSAMLRMLRGRVAAERV